MTSLNKFKQRLRGEIVNEKPSLGDWLKLVTEPVSAEQTAVEVEQDCSEDVAEVEIVDDAKDIFEISKFESMTKVQLDEYAAGHGIQLDRRQKKFNMITEFIQKIEEKN
jgi:hypothetical protein